MNQLCRVCGEPAAGFHFGAFTCEGCKSFFGRTYNNLGSISECKNNGECVINKKNRTSCKACRLRKCLVVGMSKSGSRYGRRSNWFKIHCLLQEQQQQQQQQQQQLQQHHQQPPPSPRLPQPVLPTPGVAKAKMLNLWGDMPRPGHLMDVDNNNASPATLQKMFLEKSPHPAFAATDALWRSSLLMAPHPPFLAPSFLPQPSRGFLLPFVQTLPLPLPPHVTAASSASSSSSSAASTPPPAPPPSLGPVQEQPIDLSLKGADRWDASDSDDASSEHSAKASPPAVKDTAPDDQAPRTRTTPLDLTTRT